MGIYVANQVIKKGHKIEGSKVLGITFKENCPDIRNSRVIEFGCNIDIYDPWADTKEVELIKELDMKQ